MHRAHPLQLIPALLVFLISAHPPQPASAASFTPLGDLPGGATESTATGVSADGAVVVGFSNSSVAAPEAFRWTVTGGLQGLGDLSGGLARSQATGVSGDGGIVVGFSNSSVAAPEAFVWTAAGGLRGLGRLSGGVAPLFSEALAISADGSTIVGRGTSTAGTAGRVAWFSDAPDGALAGLGDLTGGGAPESAATAVSADGSVAVGWGNDTNGQKAVRWSLPGGSAQLIGVGDLPGGGAAFAAATGVSADGSVVVGFSNSTLGTPEAFVWDAAGGLRGLGFLPGGLPQSQATGVSGDGTLVVGWSNTGTNRTGTEAFIWDAAHGMRLLEDVLTAEGVDLVGWDLVEANAISRDGTTIVGQALNPGGVLEGFVAVIPVPEPERLALGLAALLTTTCVTGWRRRSRRPARIA